MEGKLSLIISTSPTVYPLSYRQQPRRKPNQEMALIAKRSRSVVIEISSSNEEEGDSETDSTGGEDDDYTNEDVSDASSSGIESSGPSDVEDDDDADYVADDDELDDEVEESEEDEEEECERGRRSNINRGGKDQPLIIKNEEDAYNSIVNLLHRGKTLDGLKLEECKSYLRKHNLRIAGTKSICIERIQEHWRLKDGKGENFYPRSSFAINCTGDVCKGDIVFFRQKVYQKFDKVTRGANVIGKRTIAGRIVKESYGAAKQQHTFTVEVLWSKGVKALPALFPLLVKGRNLYRLKTFRQPWKNEAERSRVLHEKHRRGAAARLARAAAKSQSCTNKGPKSKGTTSSMRPTKQRKQSLKPSKVDARKEQPDKHNISKIQDEHGRIRMKEPYGGSELSLNYLRHHESFSSYHNYASRYPRHTSHIQDFPGGQGFLQTSSNVVDGFQPGHLRPRHQQTMGFQPHLPVSQMAFPMGRANLWACSFNGCREPANPACVVSCCWRCCKRTGSLCYQHR